MSIVNVQLTFPFEVTTGFRKNVANALNIGFKDLPASDSEFMDFVVAHMTVGMYLTDTISGEEFNITQYISDQIPEHMIPQEVNTGIPIEFLAEQVIEALEKEEE